MVSSVTLTFFSPCRHRIAVGLRPLARSVRISCELRTSISALRNWRAISAMPAPAGEWRRGKTVVTQRLEWLLVKRARTARRREPMQLQEKLAIRIIASQKLGEGDTGETSAADKKYRSASRPLWARCGCRGEFQRQQTARGAPLAIKSEFWQALQDQMEYIPPLDRSDRPRSPSAACSIHKAILHQERPVETIELPDLLDPLRRGVVAGERDRRVAGHS